MTTGERIKEARKKAGMTQAQLSERSGIAAISIHQYEAGKRQPQIERLLRVASVLDVPIEQLIDMETASEYTKEVIKLSKAHTAEDEPHGPWGLGLERKLAAVGCSIGFYEEDAYIWINYPDGTLEVTDAELQELDESTDSFLRFKLQELREKHPNDFKPKRRRTAPPQDTPAPQEGKDTTPPSEASQEPPEGRIQSITMICPICGQHLRGNTETGKAYCSYCNRSFPLPKKSRFKP